ncbi:hypothetical protein BofuT4_uP075590.1 [Botrytis cinerea T4]|uniref:Uncharacterized protein n=1 Tax=Botryotinia fuckeliana (strain T4) TaxID=999810 RepID=G2XNM0_BOTF4|nr:hypothetical protein BofuT4_uP075590.1 [Botrytis cinerea T4]
MMPLPHLCPPGQTSRMSMADASCPMMVTPELNKIPTSGSNSKVTIYHQNVIRCINNRLKECHQCLNRLSEGEWSTTDNISCTAALRLEKWFY